MIFGLICLSSMTVVAQATKKPATPVKKTVAPAAKKPVAQKAALHNLWV